MLKLTYNKLLNVIALISLSFYIFWNIFYLTKGEIPTSIFYRLTGIPCPTTGMFRSLNGFITMDTNAYLSNNPFVIPFLILLLFTITVLAKKYINKQPMLISNSLGFGYLFIMIISEMWMLLK